MTDVATGIEAGAEAEERLEVDGRPLRISNPSRVLWPAAGFTKRQMIRYYLAIADVLLPHLARRPVTLGRYPEGVDGPGWYQAQCRGRPSWLPTHDHEGKKGSVLRYCLVEEAAALAWLANLGTVELHPFLWTADVPFEPAQVVFDLDPGPPATIVECCRVALRLRPVLESLGLRPVVKTSGSVGLHVVAGIAPGSTFAATKAFARSIADALAAEDPSLVIARVPRSERAGRVFIDWVQNDPGRSTVAPYSLRAVSWPLVATPVLWSEVERTAASGRGRELYFGPDEVRERVERVGDLHAAALERSVALPSPLHTNYVADTSETRPRA